VDLLAVGPFGQTRALTENLRIASDLLPGGRAEYGASVAQCRLRQQCVAAGTFDLRIGVSDRWTMRVGLDALSRDSTGLRQAPYVALSGAPLTSVAVQLDAAARSRTRVALNVEPSRQLRLSMEQSWFSADPIDPLVTSRRRAQSSVYGYWRSLDARQSSLDASIDRSAFLDGGDLTRARLGFSTQMSGIRVQPYVRHDRSTRGAVSQSLAGFEAMLLPTGRHGKYAGAALLRLIGEVDARGRMQRQAMTLSMPLPGAFRVDGGVVLQRGSGGALTTLTLSRDLSALRSYTTAAISGRTASATQSVQGSALLAPGERRPQFVTGPSLQRTGVAGTVFLDRNLNGVRDAGEPAVPGVTVLVGTGSSRTDSAGRYRVWDLVPFVAMPVWVDSTSLPSPLWFASVRHTSIEAGPNRFEPLDIPLVAGGVIEGRVSWQGAAGQSLPAVPLLVTDARGTVVARTTSFSDGEFVLFGVRPGALTVGIDPAWLDAQRLTATAQQVTLGTSDEGFTLRLPPITLGGTSVNQCTPADAARCARRDDELLEGGGDEGVRLTQTHLELRDLGGAQPGQRQHDLTLDAGRAGVDLRARDGQPLAVSAARMDGDRAVAAAIEPNAEHGGITGGRNGAERQRSPDDGGRGADRAILCLRRERSGSRSQHEADDAGETGIAGHGTESRQRLVCARDVRLRTDSVSGATARIECTTRRGRSAVTLAQRYAGSGRAAAPATETSASRRAPQARRLAFSVPRRTRQPVAKNAAVEGSRADHATKASTVAKRGSTSQSKSSMAPRKANQTTGAVRARRRLRIVHRKDSGPVAVPITICGEQPC
ncbi:MAG TPA: hypothetical protein VE861_08570, partial [Gemmatimonadaceae bacterium]|nr:hypothetical protein [Gemmatimonadaceae bacterium]